MATFQPTQTRDNFVDKGVNAVGDVLRNASPSFRESQRQQQEAEAKRACLSQGGKWDEATKTCILPQKPIPEVQTPKVDPAADAGIIRDEFGKPTGFKNEKGDSFLGVDEATLQAVINKRVGGVDTKGLPDAGAGTRSAERQAQIQRILQAAQSGLLTPQDLQLISGSNPDIGQALGAGIVGAVPGIIGGAVAGGVAGAGIGSIPGAVVGAVAGGVGTFLTSIRSNIANQQSEEFAADQEALRKGDRYLRSLITDTNQNPQNAPQNIALFYQTLNMIDVAHAKTWADSQESLNTFLGKDGTQQLAKFETFDRTMRNYYIQRFQTALLTPDPSQILITNDDLQAEIEI